MSSKKKYVTVGVAEEVVQKLQEEADGERRSKAFILEKILRDYYKMPWERSHDHKKGAT